MSFAMSCKGSYGVRGSPSAGEEKIRTSRLAGSKEKNMARQLAGVVVVVVGAATRFEDVEGTCDVDEDHFYNRKR